MAKTREQFDDFRKVEEKLCTLTMVRDNLSVIAEGLRNMDVDDECSNAVELDSEVIKTTVDEMKEILERIEGIEELHEGKNISEKEYDNNDDKTVKQSFSSGVRISQPSGYQNLEPNVYLIDTFTYKLKNRETQEIVIDNCEEEKEILQIDNLLRKKTDLPGRYEDVCQPYARKPSSRDYILTLSTKIISSINYTGAKLALEDSKYCKVFLNGREIK
nr:hypothetical protein [uncultured Butyrivibrio sp.]